MAAACRSRCCCRRWCSCRASRAGTAHSGASHLEHNFTPGNTLALTKSLARSRNRRTGRVAAVAAIARRAGNFLMVVVVVIMRARGVAAWNVRCGRIPAATMSRRSTAGHTPATAGLNEFSRGGQQQQACHNSRQGHKIPNNRAFHVCTPASSVLTPRESPFPAPYTFELASNPSHRRM